MKPAPKPDNEKARLKALLCYNVLDTPAEKVFDDLTGLAADLCKTPIATITLIDEDREWYKAKVGIDEQQAPRDISFCAHTILQEDLLIVPDTFRDDRFSDNPFVLEDPPLRFYAGAPLISPDGHAIGTICVIDHVPRRLNEFQKNALKILANCVITQLESRRMTHEIFEHGKALLGSHEELERHVQERTVELTKINRKLQQEISEREKVETDLKFASFAMDHAADCIYWIRQDGSFFYVNDAACKELGYTRAQLLNMHVYDINPYVTKEAWQERWNLTRIEKYHRIETRHTAKDGRIIDVELQANYLEFEGEEYVCAIVRNISGRKQAEEAIYKSEEKYRTLVENSPYCIHEINRQGNIISMNRAGLEMMGKNREEDIMGMPYLNAVSEKDRSRVNQLLDSAWHGKPSEFEFLTVNNRNYQSSFVPIIQDGTVSRIMGLTLDITVNKQAEHALRESKTQLQNILDSLFTFVGLISIDGILLEANRAPLERASLKRENVIGKQFTDTYWWSYSIPVQKRLRKALQNAAKGKVTRYDELVRLGENEFITIDVTFGPLYDSNGNIIQIVGSAVDITERKLAEQTLYDLAEGFSVTSGEEFFRILTKHIGDTLDMDYVLVGEVVKGNDNMVRTVEVYYHGDYLVPFEYVLNGSPCQDVIGKSITSYESGVQAVFPDFHLLTNLGIEGYVGAPLFDSRGKPLGLVAVLNQRPINNIKQIESLVQIFATRAAAELERKQTEETMQFTQFTIDHLNDAAFWVADDASIIYVNDAACESLGYSRKELLDLSIPDIDPDFPAGRWVDYWRSTRHLTSATFETRHRRKDGSIFPVEIRSNHLVYQGREYRCTFAHDITERNRADATFKRTHRTLSVLSDCNLAMLHATNEQQLLDDICQIIVEKGSYRMAWVGYAEHDKSKTVRPVAHWGYEEGYTEKLNITWADNERGHGPTGIAIRTGKSYVARNIQTDPNFSPWRQAALDRGYESSVGIPLKRGEQVFGALMIYSQEPDTFDTEEMRMLEDLSDNLAFGIFAIRTSLEHVEMENALQQREEHLRFLYEKNPTMYFTVAPEGKVLSVNEFGASELGYTVDELMGKSVLTIFPENEQVAAKSHMQECLGDFGQLHEWEIQKIRKNGEKLWVKETARAVTMPDGGTAVLIVCKDITERKEVEERIKHNDQRLRNAQRIANLGFWEWNITNNNVFWSEEVFRIFGVQKDSFTATYEAFLQTVHPEDRQFVENSIDKSINKGAEYNIEHRIVLPGGETRHVKEQGEISYDESGKPVRMVGTVTDITQHKLAEEEIRMSQERLRNLATRLQAIREEERARIAREIHDELGQTLTGLKMDLVWMREHLPRSQQNMSGRVESMISLVDRKLDDTRRLAFRLRPALLDDLGLEAAIECEIQDFADRAACDFSLDLRNGTLGQDRDRDTAVFRILQEALTNVGRHAKATQIDVALFTSESELVLTIRDNGVGIDYNKLASSESLGLIGMQERAGALGGQIYIIKTSEGGTEVTLKMPITENIS